jgi:hypothetical protein
LLNVLIVNAIIASVFGGLAAHAVLLEAAPQLDVRPVVTGAGAGLCGGILMALLMLVSTAPEPKALPIRGEADCYHHRNPIHCFGYAVKT